MGPPPPTPELLRRAADGDIRAQDEVFDAWLPVVLAWCVRLGGPRVDAEDAAHDVFMVLLQRFDVIEKPDRFGSWLFGVTRRVLRKHRTRAWVRRWAGGEVGEVRDPGRDPHADLDRSETTRRVQGILDELPEKQREVLILCELEGRTAPEVSSLLEIPVGTVASRLRLARKRFELLARQASLEELVRPEGVTS